MTIKHWIFLNYWLHAAFVNCHCLQRYLREWLPYSHEWINQTFGTDESKEITPIHKTIVFEGQKITILMYRYHVEYRIGDKEIYQPYLPYHVVEFLDNDTFFLLLPIVDMSECLNSNLKLIPDLVRRLSETDLPTEHIKHVASMLGVGLAEADGAEDEPLWVIWQETADSLYGAEWWPDEEELDLFKEWGKDKSTWPHAYIPAPEGEDIFLWGKHMLSQWVSSLHVN